MTPLRKSIALAGFVFALTAYASGAGAQCSSPTTSGGGREYFSGAGKIYKLCDGARWQDFLCPDSTWTATLRGYWKFDETSGNPVDTTGNNSTSANYGITYDPTGGYREGAILMDGSSSYANAGSASSIDNLFGSGAGTANASISAWIYPTGLGENSNGQIIGKDNAASSANPTNGWTLRLTGTNQIRFTADNVTTDIDRVSANNAITLNAWNHVVVTWDGSNTATNIKIYVNGAEVSYATTTDGSGNKNSDAANNLVIGNNRVASLTRTFAGYIDELYVFTGILSTAEISRLNSRGCKSPGTCTATAQMEYNTTDKAFRVCDGVNWLQIGCTTPAVNPDTLPSSGLTGHWKFDESSGTSAADSSGNGNTGTLTNGGTFTTGQINNSVDLDGTNDFVSIANESNFDFERTQSFTLSAWVYRDTNTTDDFIFNKVTADAARTGYEVYLYNSGSCGGDGCLVVRVNNNANLSNMLWVTTNVSAVPLSTWNHVVVTYDGSSNASGIKAYVNGTSLMGLTVATNSLSASILNNVNLEVGGGSTDPFDGRIDDARVYNRVLSAAEIQELYIASFPVDLTSNLTAQWNFDETSGTTAADSSGNGNTGTLVNGPAFVAGRINNAADFDGSNDRMDIANESNFDFERTQAFSISTWINRDTATTEDDIISKYDLSASYRGYAIWMPDNATCTSWGAANGCFRFNIINTSGTNFIAVSNFSGTATGVWHHIVATYDGSSTENGMRIYVDGVLSKVNSGNTISATALNNVPLRMGDDNTADNCCEFDGKIDQTRIYSRELNIAEVRALYEIGAAVKCKSAGACATAGQVQYDATGRALNYCDGSNWYRMAE